MTLQEDLRRVGGVLTSYLQYNKEGVVRTYLKSMDLLETRVWDVE